MAGYFARKALRIKKLTDHEAQKLVKFAERFLPLEKASIHGDAVCIYLPVQLKSSIRAKVLGVLNDNNRNKRYTLKDMEVKSTIVVITNIPPEFQGWQIDNLLTGFGRTLTKFQFAKLNDEFAPRMKLGWVVFEDLYSAELCEEKVSKMKFNHSYLQAAILPEEIISENCFQELSTIQMEGYPPHFCNEPKLREILNIIWSGASTCLKYVRAKTITESDGNKRDIALLDFNSPIAACEGYKHIDRFECATEDGKEFLNLKAYFTLPGVSAFSDLCESFAHPILEDTGPITTTQNTAESHVSRQCETVKNNNVESKPRTRPLSPPPPYVETETPRVPSHVNLPPPYAPPMVNNQCPAYSQPLLPTPPQNNVLINAPAPIQPPPMSALLDPQQLYQTLLRQGHQLTFQQFQQLGMQAAQQLAHTIPIHQNNMQRIQPPPQITPTQAHIIQDGRPVVVQFANHFPPLSAAAPTNNVRPRQQNTRPRANVDTSRDTYVRAARAAPVRANQHVRFPANTNVRTPVHHAVRKADQKQRPNQTTVTNTNAKNQPRVNERVTENINKTSATKNHKSVPQNNKISTKVSETVVKNIETPSKIAENIEQKSSGKVVENSTPNASTNNNNLPTYSPAYTCIASTPNHAQNIAESRPEETSTVTPTAPVKNANVLKTPWSHKKTNAKRWSSNKKANPSPIEKIQSEAIIDKVVEEYKLKESDDLCKKVQSVQKVERGISYIRTDAEDCASNKNEEEKLERDKAKLPSEEAPEKLQPNILQALTQLSILDSMHMKKTSLANKNIFDSEEDDFDSRLLSFKNYDQSVSGLWKPLPREMFNNLF